ncbi:hypothetical protein [Chitinophaga filiformis]|uniref:Uncharacterized protein n=1 Tax=Chitinophaga filiformis TaxID=104663 RepID=A0A1G8AYV2_CHIFI|nr:hypothetical protein [Chitinophaga filiformis]SDH26061.1 hypothetical protein SAMN04488121_11042 [Chitinophaga filiformis]
MALAILQWESADSQNHRFMMDIGTNTWYRFKIGRQIINRAGIKWVDEISKVTPFQQKKKLTFLGDSQEEIRIPKNYFDGGNCYIQLLSAKDRNGTSPAVSNVIRVPAGFQHADTGRLNISSSASIDMQTTAFNPIRNISHEQQYLSQQASIEDILGSLVKAVLPVAISLLPPSANTGSNAPASGGNAASQNPTNMLTGLLGAILRAVAPGIPGLSGQQSVSTAQSHDNRFCSDICSDSNRSSGDNQFSKPFVFGIDDALLASLAGPLIQQGVQLLPQLINAANQHKLQTLQANNQLMTTLAGDVQRRLMLQQLLQNQQPGAAPNIDPAVLAQLIAQLQNAQPAAAPAAAPVATAHSIMQNNTAYTLSSGVILTFESLKLSSYNGKQQLLLQQADKLLFKIKLNVGQAPKNPLPKAIYTFYFKDPVSRQLLLEKTFKKKDIQANTNVEFEFMKNELLSLPLYKDLEIFAEVRWRTSSGKEYKAIGNTPAVFVQNYFVQQQGEAVSAEKELTDMKVYRSFWNKIWQSPSLGKSKSLWELNADTRYTVSLSAEHTANGITGTKMSVDAKDKESLTDTTSGRMKAGIELSIAELNKLLDGWDGNKPLDDEQLAAIKNTGFAKSNLAEMIYNIKMKGRTYEQGMIWIVPVFKLFDITLGKVNSLTPDGYVNELSSVKVKFPLPVSVRILGIKSNNQ